MQSFLEFSEEKKIVVKTKMGGEIPATIKVTGKDYHIVKTDSGKQYKVDHQGNSLEEEIELDEELDQFNESKMSSSVEKATWAHERGDHRQRDYHIRDAIKNTKNKKFAKAMHNAYAMNDIGDWRGKDHYLKVADSHATKPKHKNFIDKFKQMTSEEVTKEAVDDKNLPFTPDVKKTKPSTPGKYGSAYSTVRNLARKALEKQKQVKEEEQLDEKSAQARANKARKNVMDAGRGIAYRQKTGVNLQPKDTGHDSYQAMNKALGRQLRREELDQDLEENAPVAPSVGVHRIGVTVSDPGHAAVSKRNEKLQKFVRVTAHSKENAVEQGKKFYAKKGFKVHDAEHAGMVHEEVDIEEGYRGNSEADKPFFAAQDHKKEAEKARKSGDHFSYHKHMSAHHDAMEQWNSNKGRIHVANQHAMKADEHEDYAQQARKGAK